MTFRVRPRAMSILFNNWTWTAEIDSNAFERTVKPYFLWIVIANALIVWTNWNLSVFGNKTTAGCLDVDLVACKVPFEAPHMVTLPCGHLYSLQCGSKESVKPLDKIDCRYLLKYWQVMKHWIYSMCFSLNRILVEKENICGHKIMAECGRNLSRIDCNSMCEQMLDCGHQMFLN